MSAPAGDMPVAIIENLYLGDRSSAKNLAALQSLGITYVVNCTESRSEGGVHNFFEGKSHIEYLRLPVQDTDLADIAQYFEPSAEFIDKARSQGYSVLVHCQMGVSRSPTIVMAYLLSRMSMPLMQAYVLIRTKR